VDHYHIEFEPVGRRGDCTVGKSLLECARYLGVGLVSICGGFGKCKSCKVRILRGKVSPPTSVETQFYSELQLKDGWRLACLTYPESDCVVHVPPESLTTLQRMQLESRNSAIEIEPAVKSFRIAMKGPTFGDLRSDSKRVLETLESERQQKCHSLDIEVLRDISLTLRNNDWKVSASVRAGEVIALGSENRRQLGFAVDVGTTKIAGFLVDLDTGRTLASKALMNPQISYGEDITSRIHHALKSPEEALTLQKLVINGLNQMAAELCRESGTGTNEIVDAVIVGNTAIHHLFLRLPVYPLAYPPFVASVQDALDVKARDMGLNLAPGAYVHVMPNIAGFVGADHVSMLVAIDVLSISRLTLAIDIGTNTEVSLIDKDRIFSASCASGPAFEGGHVSCGMRAASGAIERLRIDNDAVQYQTIDRQTPIGICGSGIIDSIAQMFESGILDEGGRMREGHPGVRANNGLREFVLFEGKDESPAVVVTQRDVREVQLGKSAIRAGIQVLLDTAGYADKDIQHVIIAGAFGTYIDVENAMILGMLPDLPLERFQQVGNAAGLGARQSLLSVNKRGMEKAIAGRMRYIELAGTPGFNQIFIQAQYLGKYRIIGRKRESHL
jgi:uncharacterized 2Fe-2S/4Fe-4S cluster protein (DUF4445 family)